MATGEHWFGLKAKELGLVDDIQTSDDYLQKISKDKKIFFKEAFHPIIWKKNKEQNTGVD